MNTRTISIDSADFLKASTRPNGLDRLARNAVLGSLDALQSGRLVICEGNNRMAFGEVSVEFPHVLTVDVRHPRFYADIAFGGSIGAGEAWMHGYWHCDDLTGLLRLFLRDRAALERLDSGLAKLTAPLQKLYHWLNRNSRSGSRRNIAAHYDLGNEFYSLWLDPTMMYSAAFYEQPDSTLEEAAVAKLDRICRKLALKPGDRVVEIGTGWGGFAIHAAGKYGCHVTTTTISPSQYEYAKAAVRKAGLEDRVTLKLEDYRDLEGTYDKLVSIEMIEAVGHQFHDVFFRKCAELLRSDGQMLLQSITIADQRYEEYKNGVDFINRYIFPGGCLTSATDMLGTMTQHTDLRAIHMEDIGPHYATTLRHWRDRFFHRIDEVRALGYSETFVRMWEFYLGYCEAAFLERAIGDVQLLIMRPAARPAVVDV